MMRMYSKNDYVIAVLNAQMQWKMHACSGHGVGVFFHCPSHCLFPGSLCLRGQQLQVEVETKETD